MPDAYPDNTYHSTRTLAYIAVGLLGSLILCSVLFAASSFGMIFYPDFVIDAGNGERMSIPFILIGIVGALHFALFIATVVFFLVWEHRGFKNLSALNVSDLEFSPGWAVGWWFIPFANIVKPFQAMRELWTRSGDDYDAEFGFLSGSAGAPAIMGFWWAFWLLSNVADRIASKVDSMEFFPFAMIVASALEITAATLLILIIFSIVSRQEARFRRLGILQQNVPPPPPNF